MKIELDIDPVPVSRSFNPRTKKMYNEEEYKLYMEALHLFFYKKNYDQDYWFNGAIKIDIDFHISMAKSWSNKKKESLLGEYHAQKPDKDNFEKPVLDSMTGIFYKDDCQVADGRIVKRWAESGKIIINIMEL